MRIDADAGHFAPGRALRARAVIRRPGQGHSALDCGADVVVGITRTSYSPAKFIKVLADRAADRVLSEPGKISGDSAGIMNLQMAADTSNFPRPGVSSEAGKGIHE